MKRWVLAGIRRVSVTAQMLTDDLGAKDGGSATGVAAASNIIMMCLPDTADVEAILFDPNGVAAAVHPGTIVVDFSTISPSATVEFAARLSEKACSSSTRR